MGAMFSTSRYKTGLQLLPAADSETRFTAMARFDVAVDLPEFKAVDLTGGARVEGLSWQEFRLRNRMRHQHLGMERRMVEIGPCQLDLSAGPAIVTAQTATGEVLTLGKIDAPGLAAKRFRARLGAELDSHLTTQRTRRRMRLLNDAFDRVPVDFSNADWLESAIILCAIERIKANRTHDKLGRLARIRAHQGRPEAFDAFVDEISGKHGIRLPTFHGYKQTFAERDTTAVLTQLGALMDRLKGLGLTVFANSGTLLGLVRDGRLIGHDDDVDLAVILKAKTQETAAVEWAALRDRIRELGLLANDDHKTPAAVIKLTRIDGVEVDLFPAWIDSKSQVFVYPHTKGDLPRAGLLPLADGPAPGLRFPRDPRAMLALNYGAGWEKPDPTFRFPWDEAARVFAPFLATLKEQE